MIQRSLWLLILVSIYTHATHKIVSQKGSYTLSEQDLKAFVTFGEFMARSDFSPHDTKALAQWAIDSFQKKPKENAAFYKQLHTKMMPELQTNNKEQYRVEVYLAMRHYFAKKPQHPYNLLSVVNRYNPPLKEALALEKQQQKIKTLKSQMALQSTLHLNHTMRKQMQLNTIMRLGGKVIRVQGNQIVYRDKYGIRRVIYF